mmetsp:Transcript_28100/g.82578  ORF Transcript_28100/g.82578 Transcript_28100/m.82578 type:complete len:235 (+) Transcript_28100:53-757(+)
MARVLVAWSVVLAAVAGRAHAARDASTGRAYCASFSSCDACMALNDDESTPAVCSWCYSSDSCVVAYERDASAAPLTVPGSCKDWTMDRKTCACRPFVYTDCETCTANPECVWIRNATSFVTTTVHIPGIGMRTSQLAHPWHDVCWSGSPFTGPSFEEREMKFLTTTMVMNSTSPDWCWYQCSVPGSAFIVLIILGVVCGLTILACALRCLYNALCRKEKKRRRSRASRNQDMI